MCDWNYPAVLVYLTNQIINLMKENVLLVFYYPDYKKILLRAHCLY